MQDVQSSEARSDARGMVVGAVWMGLAVGLVEGAGWLIVQRFGRITNLWTQVVWIAPIVDALLFLVLGLFLAALAGLLPRRIFMPLAGFSVAFAAAANFVALCFQSFIHPAAQLILALGIASALNRGFLPRQTAVLGFCKRTLVPLAGFVLFLFISVQGFYMVRERSAVAGLREDDGRTPNVLVVVIDALRADRVSAYGNARQTSPFIDELAGGGVLFERALASAPYTLPSHASLLSGLRPSEHGVEWLAYDAFADGDYPSIAETLLDGGYRTGAFSANPYWFTREQGFGRGFTRFEDFYHNGADMAFRTVFGKAFERLVMFRLGLEDVPARKRATESTDRVLDWAGREGEHPFFAFVNYFDVHDPYLPPQPYRSRFSDEEEPGGFINWRMLRGLKGLTPEQTASEMAAYDGALAYVDAELRRLVDGIGALDSGRDLIVIVTSDHGEAFGEHGAYIHAKSLYREEIQIPLVVWGPGHVPAGLRVSRPVTHSSIPATILELVGGAGAPTYGSPSLVSLWADSTAAEAWPWPLSEIGKRDWEDEDFPVHHGDIKSLFSPDWHYLTYDTLPEQLFEWSDEREQRDRAGAPEAAELLPTFRALVQGRRRPSP